MFIKSGKGVFMRSKEKGEASRDRLLRSAGTCFSREGFDGTSVDKICRHAKLSKGGFYHHFSSKQDLVIELLDRWLNKIDKYIESARKDSQSLEELIINIAGHARPFFIETSDELPLFLELWLKSSRDPRLRKRTIIFYEKYIGLFKGILESGVKNGSIKNVDPDRISRIIVAIAVGLMMQGLLDPGGTDWDGVAKDSSVLVLKGLAENG